MDIKKQFEEGLLSKNPVLVQLLSMCSTLAITTSMFNGIGMGLSVTIILICSNVLISALRKIIPSEIRIAAYIVIIAGFVTIVDLILQAFLPDLAESLGVFIPLIVVNCIILGRAEAFASKNTVLASARPRMIQLTTISGINTPKLDARSGKNACSSRSTMVTKPAMITI